MKNLFEKSVKVTKMANSGQEIELKQDLISFKNLILMLESELGSYKLNEDAKNWRYSSVNTKMQFGYLDKTKKIPILEGNLSVNLYIICQRCLEVFEFPLNISLKYAFLIRDNNFVKNIKYEIWELSNERLNIYDFIEEILIISIPLYPSHKSNENCNLLLNNVDGKNKNKPFSSLKDLIK